MHLSRKITKIISAAAIFGFLATSAVAGQNGKGAGDRDGTADQDRSREKSCTLINNTDTGSILIAKQNGKGAGDRDGTADQDRSREKSC